MGRSIMIVAVFMVMCGCNSSSERITKEADSIHNQSIKMGRGVARRLEVIEALLAVSDRQSDPAWQDSLQILQQDLRDWKTIVVEVPGSEHHDHPDHPGHDHGALASEITPEMALEIQNEIFEMIGDLDIRSRRLLKLCEKSKKGK